MEILTNSKYFNGAKELLKPTDIYSAIKPLYYLSKIFGLAPFYYRRGDPEGRIQISLLGTIHSCLMCCVLTILSVVLCRWYLEREFDSYNLIVDVVVLSDLLVSSFDVIMTYVLCATINRSKIMKLLVLVSLVDTYLNKTINSYKTTCVSVIYGIVVFLLVNLCCIVVSSISLSHVEHYMVHFICCLFHIVGMITYFQFFYSVLLLKHRFRVLNEDLLMVFDIEDEPILDDMQLVESLSLKFSNTKLEGQTLCQGSLHQSSTFEGHNCLHSKQSNSERINISPSSEDWRRSVKIRKLREAHSTLCDAAELTNSIFQVQILVGFVEIFVEITLCLYATLTYVTGLLTCQLYTPSKWNMLGVFLMWAAMHLCKLIVVTASCHGVSQQSNRSAVLIQKLLVVQWLCAETTTELNLFSQQLLHRNARFTACGFFPIDFTLLYSMAGSVTTYLIILLQYTGEDLGSLIELCHKTFNETL